MKVIPPSRPVLLVLASTYPRWRDDPEPGFVHELSRRLTDRFDVHVITPHFAGALRKEDLDGVHVHRFRYAPAAWETLVSGGGMLANVRRDPLKWLLVPGFLLAMFFSLLRLVRSLRPALVHGHWIIPQGVIIALARYFCRLPPVVLTSHGGDLFSLKNGLMGRLKSWVMRRIDHLSVVSEAMVEPAQVLGMPHGQMSVLPMGVDLDERFTPSEVARSDKLLLFVGRLVEKKGLAHLLNALPILCQRYPGLRLRIVGFGPLQESLLQRAVELGLSESVEFVGAVAQEGLAPHYREATLLVAPFVRASTGDVEGLGLVSIEAIGCQCPVILGDVPAVWDVLAEQPEWIVNPQDLQALIAAVSSVLDDPEAVRNRVDTLRGRLYQRFSWSAVAQRYIHLFDNLIPDSGARQR
ncbi:glycosyltransferase family 4 protein [Pseudomonas nicosulfuronedens]|nr:glycosyltransferase family 4 protein [Pseudomonas nicosulfuronedens]MDH1007824.1 glycosyltransferase family 4 protein [Pseudomonas nicosulfuronedens]MDH1982532.1 glycosyltransferase family 4 protein [Pseudomonas nicosulfuronedens]MDH2024935.1 glycosyltransferase family 4 protein [Pseudomonas nicosulfuronedens]